MGDLSSSHPDSEVLSPRELTEPNPVSTELAPNDVFPNTSEPDLDTTPKELNSRETSTQTSLEQSSKDRIMPTDYQPRHIDRYLVQDQSDATSFTWASYSNKPEPSFTIVRKTRQEAEQELLRNIGVLPFDDYSQSLDMHRDPYPQYPDGLQQQQQPPQQLPYQNSYQMSSGYGQTWHADSESTGETDPIYYQSHMNGSSLAHPNHHTLGGHGYERMPMKEGPLSNRPGLVLNHIPTRFNQPLVSLPSPPPPPHYSHHSYLHSSRSSPHPQNSTSPHYQEPPSGKSRLLQYSTTRVQGPTREDGLVLYRNEPYQIFSPAIMTRSTRVIDHSFTLVQQDDESRDHDEFI